jgi:hypothetical protein
MNNKSLELLKEVTSKNAIRQTRSLDLLKHPEKDSDGWFMCVPSCFNEALDIKQTERVTNGKKTICWTQGASFSFKPGDTIYDTPIAYEVWSEALKHINICFSVNNAINAGASEDGKCRYPGLVTFVILKPDEQRTKLMEQEEQTLSQDDFVNFLITGNKSDKKN